MRADNSEERHSSLFHTPARAHTHGGGGAPYGTEAKRFLLFLLDQSAKVEPNSFRGAANEHQRWVVTQEQRVDKEWGVQSGLKKGARRFGGPAGTRQSTYSGSSSSVVTHMCTSNTILSKHTGKEKCSTASRPLSLSLHFENFASIFMHS